MNIYVGNLNYKVDENDLEGIFEKYGKVNSAKVIMDKITGRSKGFGFVEMTDGMEANNAIKELNGATLEEREIVVNEARPRKNNY
jgi:RNA recognition motif-containing protein